MPKSWADELRAAIKADGRTTYALAKVTEIDRRQLDRFIAGERSLGIESAERLGRALGLKLVRDEC